MKKKLITIAGITILAFLSFLIAVPLFFKGEIVERIKLEANKNINANLSFDNDIGLNLFKNFPNLSITLSNVGILGKDEFEGDTLLYFKSMQVVVDLKTLWDAREVSIRKFYALDPYVNIIYHKNGKANYEIIKPNGASDTTKSSLKVNLDVYEIKNGRIKYNDEGIGFSLALDGVNHLGSGNFQAMVFDLKTKTDVRDLTMKYGGVAYLNHVKAMVDAKLNVDLNTYRFEFKENVFACNDLAVTVNGFLALPNDTDMEMDLAISNNQTEFKKLLSLLPALYKNKFESLQSEGEFGFTANVKGVYSDYQMPSFGLHLGVKNGSFKYPDLPQRISNVNMALHINNPDGVMDHTNIDLQQFHAAVGDDILDGNLKITNPISNTFLDIALDGRLNLATITQIVPLADTKLSGLLSINIAAKGNVAFISNGDYEKLKASGKFIAQDIVYESKGALSINLPYAAAQLSPSQITLADCKIGVGHSDIEAEGKLENFFGFLLHNGKIKGALNITSNMLDVNEMLNSNKADGTADTSVMKPVKIPENIDFLCKSKIKSLRYNTYNISNVLGEIHINDGELAIENASLEMLDAKFVLNGKYNSREISKPIFNFDFGIQNLDIQKAFVAFKSVKSLAPMAALMKGNLNSKLTYYGAFDRDFNPILNSITSLGSLNIAKATMEGGEVLALLSDQLQLTKLKRFDMQNLLLNFMINKGEVIIKPFKTKWNNYGIELLEGVTGLDKNMSFHLKLSIPRSEFGATNTALNSMIENANKNTAVPVMLGDNVDVDVFIKGNMLKPEITTSLRNMANKALDDLRDVLVKRAQDSLNNLKLLGESQAREASLKLINAAKLQADKIKMDASNYANIIKLQAYKTADSLVNSVQNPLGKMAAKVASEKLKKEADAKAQRILNEATINADALLEEAKRKAGLQQ